MSLNPGDWIAITGVVATGVFSYLIWKATKQGVEIAKASYRLSESIVRKQNENEEALKKEYREKVFNKAVRAASKLFDVLDNNYCLENLKELDGLGLTDKELVKYFNAEEREKIKRAFDEFSELVKILGRRKKGEALDLDYVRHCKGEMWELIKMLGDRI